MFAKFLSHNPISTFFKYLKNESSFHHIFVIGRMLYSHPFEYKTKERIIVIGSYTRRSIWLVKSVIVTVYSIGNCYSLYLDAVGPSPQPFSLTLRESSFAAMSIFCIVLQYNTWVNMVPMTKMFSSFHSLKLNLRNYEVKDCKIDRLGHAFKLFQYFYITLVMPQILRSNSGFNVYHGFGGTKRSGILFFGFLNTLLVFQIVNLVLFYSRIILDSTSILHHYLQLLSSQADNPRQDIKALIKSYKMISLCCEFFLASLSSIVLTTSFLASFFIQIVMYFCLITFLPQLDLRRLAPILIASLVSTSIAKSVIGLYNLVQQTSKKFIQYLHHNPRCSNYKNIRPYLKSLTPIYIHIGPFFVIKKGTYPTMMSLVTNTVINMLLAT